MFCREPVCISQTLLFATTGMLQLWPRGGTCRMHSRILWFRLWNFDKPLQNSERVNSVLWACEMSMVAHIRGIVIRNIGYWFCVSVNSLTMSYLLPSLRTKSEVDNAIKTTEDVVLALRFGRETDPNCMRLDDIVSTRELDGCLLRNITTFFTIKG